MDNVRIDSRGRDEDSGSDGSREAEALRGDAMGAVDREDHDACRIALELQVARAAVELNRRAEKRAGRRIDPAETCTRTLEPRDDVCVSVEGRARRRGN